MERIRPTVIRLTLLVFLLLANLGTSFAQTHWVGSWAASQQLAEAHNSLPSEYLTDITLRQIVRCSIGGPELRVRLSNRFGTAPLHMSAVHVARPIATGSGAIVSGTDRPVTFSGKADVTIPVGDDYVSDPISFPVAALSDLAITLHLQTVPAQQTGHPGSRATSYIDHGNLVAATELPAAKKVPHWYFVAGIDVVAPPEARAIAVLGDSITDGYGTTTDGNNRWPDLLASRLQSAPASSTIAVLNHGIGGNRLLADGLGPSALSRFDRDVLAQTGIETVIILEGVNDLGMLARVADVPQTEHGALVRRIIGAYEEMIERARARRIRVIGATILPFVGSEYYHPGPGTEADRQAVNDWIRTSGHFDAVIDFDKIMRDPANPDRLLPTFDSGDHLHPSLAGYAAMAEAVPVSLLVRSGSRNALPAPQIAFTFDDLPAHGSLPPGETRLQVVSKIIAAMQDAHVPSTYGFVNGVLMQHQPADAVVLQSWLAAGHKLGNHTWSHMNLNQHTLEDYRTEIERNESLLRDTMKNEDWRWFRYPFLARGETPEKRDAIRSFLQQRGYKIAGVTMGFADYLYNEPYARCSAKGDAKAIALLESTYLAAADENINYDRALSQSLFGRDIPYVLLMHLGAFDARMMPRLLDLYRSKGFQFVTLEQAESDDFYKTEMNLNLPATADNLEGTMGQRNLTVPPHSIPAPQFDNLCR